MPSAADDRSPVFLQYRAKRGAMTVALVLAIASHGEVGALREARQELEDPDRGSLRHLPPVAKHEPLPVLRRVGEAFEPTEERRARGQVGQSGVVVVQPRVVFLLNATRRPPHGSN